MDDEAEAGETSKSALNRKDQKTRSPEEQAQLTVNISIFSNI